MTRGGLDEGTGIRLRPLAARDGDRLLAMLDDPDQRRWGSPAFVEVPTELSALEDRYARSRDAWDDAGPGTLAVVATDDDRFLGEISWRWAASAKMAIADLGYVVHPDARGRGVARTAMVLLTRWLLDPDGRGLARVQLDHSVENVASCRVALAAGFGQEGIRRGFLPLREPDGSVRRHDVCLHGTLDPPPLPPG